VALKNGSLTFVDDAQKSKMEVSKLNAVLSLEGLQNPFRFDGSAEWNGRIVKVNTQLSTLQSLLNEEAHGSEY